MTELYNEVKQIIDFELDEDEEKYSSAYCRNLWRTSRILTSLVVIGGIFAIYCLYANIRWVFYAFFIFAFVSTVCFKAYRKKYMNHITQLIKNDCCVRKTLTSYMVMLQYSRRGEKQEVLLTSIGMALFYLGKFDACKEIADLIERKTDTTITKAYRCSLLAMVAWQEENKEMIALCKEEMETLTSQTPEQYVRNANAAISKCPEIIEAEKMGDYDKMVMLMNTGDGKNTTLKKVCENYYLYQTAKIAGLDAKAEEHLAYVLENGGDTFYKMQLERAN